jgi:hypothetical protein
VVLNYINGHAAAPSAPSAGPAIPHPGLAVEGGLGSGPERSGPSGHLAFFQQSQVEAALRAGLQAAEAAAERLDADLCGAMEAARRRGEEAAAALAAAALCAGERDDLRRAEEARAGELEEARQQVKALEEALSSIDLDLRVGVVLDQWDQCKRSIPLRERAVLNALASAVRVQERLFSRARAEAEELMRDADAVRRDRAACDEAARSFDERERAVAAGEASLRAREAELRAREAALAGELEVAIGPGRFERSALLRELRLAVVENEALRLRCAELDGGPEASRAEAAPPQGAEAPAGDWGPIFGERGAAESATASSESEGAGGTELMPLIADCH